MAYKSVMSSPRTTRSVARLLLLASLPIAAIIVALTFHPLFAQSQDGTIDTFTLSSTTDGEIVLSWETPSPAPSDYRVSYAPNGEDYLSWRDDNEDGRGNTYPDGSATSLTLTGLPNGTLYKVSLRARYRTGEYANNRWSGPWNEQTVTVAGQPAGTVTGLTLSSDAAGSLTIAWDTPSPSPSDYRVNWAQVGQGFLSWSSPNEESRGNEYPTGNTNSLTLTGLTEGAEFKVKMRARYRTGEYANDRWAGPWTSSVRQEVLEQTTQATSTATSTLPATSTATSTTPATTTATSTLPATSTATSTVQATTTPQSTTTSTSTPAIGAPSGLNASLQNLTKSIGGGNSEGIGTKGFFNGIGTRADNSLATTSMYVMLSWTNPSGGVAPTGYQVKRWVTDNHPTFFDCDISSTTSSCYSAEEYRDSQLTAGVTFNYEVRLVKRASGEDPRWSPWSGTVTIAIPAGLTADSYPEAPAGLTAAEVLHETDDPKITVSWDAVTSTDTITYTIIRADLKSATPTAESIATTTATTYDDTEIEAYRSYQYRIQATNSLDLSSPLSRLRIVNTSGLQYGVPDRPTDLSAATTTIATTTVHLGTATSSDTSITLSWTPATTGATSTYYLIYAGVVTEAMYRAYERPEDAVITVRVRRMTTSPSTTFNVGSGSFYAFGVKSCNDEGCSSLSQGHGVNLLGELGADLTAPGQPETPGTS